MSKPKKTVIVRLSRKNPKREGSKSYERFARYRTGMTVEGYAAATDQPLTAAQRDVNWDVEHGYIRLEER